MPERPKYARAEIERRWLASAGLVAPLLTAAPLRILDLYLEGTRLRLRRVTAADGGRVYKLCKKYGDRPPGSESITNLYLSRGEFEQLQALGGWEVEKQRYRLHHGSLDVYQRDTDRLLLFEREFAAADLAADCEPPAFAGREITADPDFSGAALARRFGQRRGGGGSQ